MGVKAVEDPALMDYPAEHQIGIESCLTSNVQNQHRGFAGPASTEAVP